MPETRTGHHSLFLSGIEGGGRLNSDLLLPCQKTPTLILRFSTHGRDVSSVQGGSVCSPLLLDLQEPCTALTPSQWFGGGRSDVSAQGPWDE